MREGGGLLSETVSRGGVRALEAEACRGPTLHPSPSTSHPTPYALFPTPSTLFPTPSTPHPSPYTLHGGVRSGATALHRTGRLGVSGAEEGGEEGEGGAFPREAKALAQEVRGLGGAAEQITQEGRRCCGEHASSPALGRVDVWSDVLGRVLGRGVMVVLACGAVAGSVALLGDSGSGGAVGSGGHAPPAVAQVCYCPFLQYWFHLTERIN